MTVPLTITPESMLRTRTTSPSEPSVIGVPEAISVMLPIVKTSLTLVPRVTSDGSRKAATGIVRPGSRVCLEIMPSTSLMSLA
ncbi:hypothetical protein D3C86_1558630 [compost metagenome]